ncbi:MAG TPA: hypothetical protein VJI46_00600 [Candidatus Nanoarchaeia archaeon]|nr:hypothetical protein [Candidatus Nanoarchaeia archaeon]
MGILDDVDPEKSFWVNNGPVVNNLQQLPDALRKMKNGQFAHHVNRDKNDFANWIRDVVGDAKLADEIAKTTKKNALINIIERRISTAKKGK